ncbi:MAG TPA: alpha/beta hydrolase [Stellaceae bacterium]|nr:alpha/beta hydrolase [Stellaceae bacterium]
MSIAPVPAEHLALRLAAPQWFRWAIGKVPSSRIVTVEGCPIHYLAWPHEGEAAPERGLLFVHGGGAHAHWWAFVAPYFIRDFRVVAIDLSGMGDSGRRETYGSEIRARELLAVIADADLGRRPFIVGHSFGGFMTMKFASQFGDTIGGAVIVDSPIRSPEAEARRPLSPPVWGNKKIYPDFEAAAARFRLMPPQSCENDFIVEYIARHSLMPVDGGWTWKFDGSAIGARRFGEPFREYLQAVQCRAALIFGEKSALVSRRTAAYMSSLMGPLAPIVEVPEAQHHVMLDQPLAFVAALRMLLESWIRAEPVRAGPA